MLSTSQKKKKKKHIYTKRERERKGKKKNEEKHQAFLFQLIMLYLSFIKFLCNDYHNPLSNLRKENQSEKSR